jgi:hypothetical protein
MGLDWIIKSKPKPGVENRIQYKALKEKIVELHDSLNDYEKLSPNATQIVEVITELKKYVKVSFLLDKNVFLLYYVKDLLSE